MTGLRLWVAAVLCLLAGAVSAQNCIGVQTGLDADRGPQNTSRDIVGKSLDDIIERGWILFSVYENFAPYSWRENGELKGIDIELGRIIAADLGVEARFNETLAGENVETDLRYNIWKGHPLGGPIANVMLHVPYDHQLGCRIEQVVLTGPYFNEKLAIAYSRETFPKRAPTPTNFQYDKVGVENDSIADFYLSSLMRGALVPNIAHYASPAAAMSALDAREIPAVVGAKAQLEFGLTEGLGIDDAYFGPQYKTFWTVGVAVHFSWRPLGYAVDDAIRAAVEDGRLAKVFADYGLSYTAPDW